MGISCKATVKFQSIMRKMENQLEAERKAAKEKKEAKKEKRAAAREAAIADQTLDYVLIAGQESRTSGSSAIARGAVGHAVLGPVGLLAARRQITS